MKVLQRDETVFSNNILKKRKADGETDGKRERGTIKRVNQERRGSGEKKLHCTCCELEVGGRVDWPDIDRLKMYNIYIRNARGRSANAAMERKILDLGKLPTRCPLTAYFSTTDMSELLFFLQDTHHRKIRKKNYEKYCGKLTHYWTLFSCMNLILVFYLLLLLFALINVGRIELRD